MSIRGAGQLCELFQAGRILPDGDDENLDAEQFEVDAAVYGSLLSDVRLSVGNEQNAFETRGALAPDSVLEHLDASRQRFLGVCLSPAPLQVG